MLYERGLAICRPYSTLRHIIRMCLVGNYLIASGKESNRCCLKESHAGVVVGSGGGTLEADHQPSHVKSWPGFSICCARAVSGTPRPKSMDRARPCTATFSTGTEPESSKG